MSNHQQLIQYCTLSVLRDNSKLKMRFKSLIICMIITCTTTYSCLALQEQSTIDLISSNASRTSSSSAGVGELVTSKLISSSSTISNNDTTNRAQNVMNSQPESSYTANSTLPSTNNVTQNKLPVSTYSPSPLQPAEQLHAYESRESPGSDFSNYNYNLDEAQDGSDLNFSLMNAPHDKLQAVKHLINTERSILASQSQQHNDQSMAQGVSQHCNYKGKQYLNGQNVPIEEQPCLNCTCRRAILQCYLRVCPPIISLEAHKKMQVLSKRVSGENCRMVKEAHQCCPSLKCDPIASEETSRTATLSSDNFSSSPIQFVPTPSTNNRFGAAESDVNTVSVGSDTNSGNDETIGLGTRRLATIRNEGAENGVVLRFSQPFGSATNRSISENNNTSPSNTILTTTPSYLSSSAESQREGNLPKLTVIKGSSGQPDSILLITSNPSSVNNILSHGNERSSSQQMMLNSSRSATTSAYSDALLNALLETVYTSVTQLNGLNLQGSCMINGSLYVEGSAVMPEGNAYCQYCYCIRQKIMCVKPKCHLMISGCSPRYSNEYACCPTSYSCTNSDISSTNNNKLPGLRSNPSSAAKLANSNESQNLSAKLSSAIDSISRMQPSRPERQATSGAYPNEAVSARQIDGILNPDSLQAAMLNLMNSIGMPTTTTTTTNESINEKATSLNRTSPNGTDFDLSLTFRTMPSDGSGSTTSVPMTTTTATSPSSTSTAAATSSSSSTTTTTITTPSPSNSSTVGTRSADKGEDSEDDGEEEEEVDGNLDKQQDKATGKNKKGDKNQLEAGKKKLKPTSSSVNLLTNTTTEQPSSVSDFLEPMNKLGPLIMSLSSASSCNENGRQYAIGVQIPTLEACKHCYCGLEGVKECKKVECGLKTPQRNGCKPVTPEGHCCPIRYDCPPFIQLNQGSEQIQQHNNNRYRFEESPFSQADISQCNNDSGEACSNKLNANSNSNSNNFNNNNNYADQSGNSEIENIKGLSEITDLTPIVRTTRILPQTPNWSPLTTVQPQFPNNSSSNAGLSGLTEELNKFIMQINQNTSQGSGYSMLPSFGGNLVNMNDTPASVSTHEMMINDQRSKMVDYHSVQAPPSSEQNGSVVGIPSIVPEPIRNLMKGDERVLITNGEIIPVADPNMANKLLASTVEYAMNDNGKNFGNNVESNNQNNFSGSRDSRSTNAHKLNDIISTDNNVSRGGHVGFIELANLSVPLNAHLQPQQLPPSLVGQPFQPEIVHDDYIDGYINGNNSKESEDYNLTTLSDPSFRKNVSNLPHVRLMRNNHNLSPETNRFRHLIQNNPNNLPLVIFDDSVSNNSNNNNNNSNNNNNNTSSMNNSSNSIRNQTQLPAFGRIESARPLVTSDQPSDDEENSTPTPPQPTTGTPIGLDADRGPETRGWLKSLSGLVNSFGRRLVPGSIIANELDGAASDGEHRENQAGQIAAVGTARSKQQSLFNHLMQMLSNSEQQITTEIQEQPRNLVMRPLANIVQIESDGGATISSTSTTQSNPVSSNKPRSWPPILSSPYEPVSSSEIEIVTAATPSQFLEPDLLGSTLVKVAENEAGNRDTFARRSDIGQDIVLEGSPSVSVAPRIESRFLASDSREYPATSKSSMLSPDISSFNRVNKQIVTINKLAENPPAKHQSKVLTCYDQLSNKTYQANENWIPTDDHCKTCTCILGEERCQTLTCPEKPAENCKEERRSDECCASYTCGTNLGSQPIINQVSPTTTTTTTTASVPNRGVGEITGSNARMMMPIKNNQQMATPRAMNTDQVGVLANNGIEFNHQRGPTANAFSQPPVRAINQNIMNNFQQIPQAVAGNNQVMRNIPSDNIRRQQLPQHPIKVNDLPNILPPHLRFRPNFQGNQLASNYLTDPKKNQVLFFNQGSSLSDQRFPLQNFISRRNDNNNINFRIPLHDALNQISQKPPRSSAANPTVAFHPQKAPTSLGGFNQPLNGQTISKNNLQVVNGDNIWRLPVMNDNNNNVNNLVNNGGNLPTNILIPRMSGEQQREPTMTAGNNLTGPEPVNWQPSSFMMPNDSNQHHRQQQQQKQQPQQIPTSQDPIKSDADHVIPTENNASTNEVSEKDRTHFLTQPTNRIFSQNPSSAPPVDSGFRPIVPLILTTQHSALDVNTLQTQEASTTTRQNVLDPTELPKTTKLPPSMKNRQQSTGEITMPAEDNFTKQDYENPAQTSYEASTTSAGYPSSNSTPSSTTTATATSIIDETSEKPRESDQGRPGSILEMTSTTVSNQPYTTTTIASSSTTLEPNTGKQESNELSSSSQSPQATETTSSDQSTSSDPMSMFRVSECNIYGRIYPVGQVIKELSDSCKRCICSSMGVECENNC